MDHEFVVFEWGERLTVGGATFDQQMAAAKSRGDRAAVATLERKMQRIWQDVVAEAGLWSWEIDVEC